MRTLCVLVAIVALTGCAYTVFAPPAVLYSDADSIGAKYRNRGLQSYDNPAKAMQLIADHCAGKYEIAARTETDGWITVDANCE